MYFTDDQWLPVIVTSVFDQACSPKCSRVLLHIEMIECHREATRKCESSLVMDNCIFIILPEPHVPANHQPPEYIHWFILLPGATILKLNKVAYNDHPTLLYNHYHPG